MLKRLGLAFASMMAALLPTSSSVASPATLAGPASVSVRCARSLAIAIKDEFPAILPPPCWQVGPIRLGMSEVDVERQLGKPVARSSTRDGVATLYAFPQRAGSLVVNGRAHFRMAELRFADDHLIAIDNDPGSQTTISKPCRGANGREPRPGIDLAVRAGPLLRFAGTTVGDSLLDLRKRYGRQPAGNRSRDWFSYLPVPLSFDADRGRIEGFTIAKDAASLTAPRSLPRLKLHRDPIDCRLESIDFAL